MGDHAFYDILSLDENNVVEARNIKATVPSLLEHQNPQPTHSDPDVLGASALSRAPVQSHASIGQVDATMDTSPGGGIVPAVPGAASLQAKKVMSLGHLRRQFDSIDVEQTGFIKQEQFVRLAASLGMVVRPSMIVPQMTFNVFVRHYYANQSQQRRTSIAGRNRHLTGHRPRQPLVEMPSPGADDVVHATPCVDLSHPGVPGAGKSTVARSSVTPWRQHGTPGSSAAVFERTAQTTDDLPRGGLSRASDARRRHGLPTRSATVIKIDEETLQSMHRVRTPVTAYPNLAAPSRSQVSPVLKPNAVGIIPVLVQADLTSDEEKGFGAAGSFGKRAPRIDALSSDEEGPRLPLQRYRRRSRPPDPDGASTLFAPPSIALADDDEIKSTFSPKPQHRNSTLREFSISPVGMAKRSSGHNDYISEENDIDVSRGAGKPLTPLPDLRAPLLSKGMAAVDVYKRHRGHMARLWESHAAALISGVPGGVATVDSGQNSMAIDSRTPGGATFAQHTMGDAIDMAGMDENKMHLPFVVNRLVDQRTGDKPVVLEPQPSITKRQKKKSNKRKTKRRHAVERGNERYFAEGGLEDGSSTGLHSLLQEARQTRRCQHQDHYVAKDRQTLTPLTKTHTQMEGVSRTKTGLVADALDENVDAISDETVDKVATKTKTPKVGRLLSPLVHKAAKDSSSRERRRGRRRKRRSPSLRQVYRGSDTQDTSSKPTASPQFGQLKRKGASRIDGPQLLGVYGRQLDAASDPLAITGVKKQRHDDLYDPNESSLEQSEIQSRLRLWQERQEQIERQEQELRAMMREEQAQRAFGDRFWGCIQPLMVDGKKKPILTM